MNAGSIQDAEPAAASDNAQDFSGVARGPARAMEKGGRVPTPTRPSYNSTQQPSQSNSLQQLFNSEDPDHEELLKERSAILTENKRLQTCLYGMEQQNALLSDEREALLSTLDLQMRHGQEMEKKCNDLHLKIDELEALHRRQALAESGFYQDSAATPPLLQNAADGVKDAIAVFAREVFSTFKETSSVDFDAVQEGVPADIRSNEAVKAGLQGMICRVFFQGFGDPYFSLREKPVPPFQTPSEEKAALLQDFRRCRDNHDPKQLLLDDSDFRLFFNTKVAAMNQEIEIQLLRPTKVQFAIESFANGVLNPENENSIYSGTFVRAAKTVWVLHKVAMSFEPRAEILRVGRGSSLDRTYMEDIATHDENAEENETAALQKQVMFMCNPGFTVRNTVIKSKVFCLLPTIKPEAADPADLQTGNGATSGNLGEPMDIDCPKPPADLDASYSK